MFKYNILKNLDECIEKNNRLSYLVISFFSLLSLIPFIFLMNIVMAQLASATFNGVTPEELDYIFNKTILTWDILTPFSIGIFTWIANAYFSIHFLNKKFINNTYAFTTLVLGGIGIHLLLWAIIELKKKLNIKPFNFRKILWKAHAVFMALISLFIIPIFSTLRKDNPNSPIEGHPIHLSLDSKHPNIIEIFSDGLFRRSQTYPMSQEKALKDFSIYNKFISLSGSTYSTVPSIWGNLGKYNQIAIESKLHNETYVHASQTRNFFDSFVEHVGAQTDPKGIYKNNINLINPINITKKTGYNEGVAGSISDIKRLKPNWNITNWSGARDFIGMGINNHSPDVMAYKWLNTHIIASHGNKPARVYISDLITHPPILNNRDGTFKLGSSTRKDQWYVVRQNLINLVQSLKLIKDQNGRTAYDNTLIIMYGDHKDHTFSIKNKKGFAHTAVSSESLLLIKYPHTTNKHAKVVNDRVVYSPQINVIMKNIIDNPNNNTFIEKNKMFEKNSERWVLGGKGIFQVAYGKNKNWNPGWDAKTAWENLEPEFSINPVLDKNNQPIELGGEQAIAKLASISGGW